MGVRPWLLLLQGEVSAFLLHPWGSAVPSAPSEHVGNSQVSSPELPQSAGVCGLWRRVMGEAMAGGLKDLRGWSSS